MKPTLALIINTYNQADYLRRVLRAVSAQNEPADEVLLADDGSDDSTGNLFQGWARRQESATAHVWQKHEGFRRSRILNATISQAESDYVVFLDGDTIPHPSFLSDHRRLARQGCFIQGHRALVEQAAAADFGRGDFVKDRRRAFMAAQLRGLKHIFRWPRPFKWPRPDLDGVRGCNLAMWRADLFRVNGYNEDFTGWGCEDLELASRLLNAGVRRLDVRGWALCYHLWHPLSSRANLGSNRKILAETVTQKRATCGRGLNQAAEECLVFTGRVRGIKGEAVGSNGRQHSGVEEYAGEWPATPKAARAFTVGSAPVKGGLPR